MMRQSGYRTDHAAKGAEDRTVGGVRCAGAAKLPVAAMIVAVAAAGLVPGKASAQEGERASQRCVCTDSPSARVWRGTWSPPRLSFDMFGSRVRLGVVLAEDEEGVDGVRIERVTQGWPAEEAGLRAGDVITAVDGKPLTEPVEGEDAIRGYGRYGARLVAALQNVEPGDTVEIEYRRDGRTHTVSVATRSAFDIAFSGIDGERLRRALDGVEILRASPVTELRAIGPLMSMRGAGWARVNGIELTDLDPELGEYFDAERGVLVVRVDEEASYGLRPGDVILRIDGREVADARHATVILRSYREGEPMEIEIIRRGSRTTVEGRGAGRPR